MASVSSLIKSSSWWAEKLVVRWALVVSLLILWSLGSWFRTEYGTEDSNLWLVMQQFIRLLGWTAVLVTIISVFSTLVAWGYFIHLVGRKSIRLQVRFGDGLKAEAGTVPLQIGVLGPVIRPLLGRISARLVFEGNTISEPVLLDNSLYARGSIWREGVKGTGYTVLHDRGIYDVEMVDVAFGDMLGLVKLPYPLPFSQQLYTLPREMDSSRAVAQPQSTEEQKHRIDIPRRVEGEYVNYKEFEPGDNIQRIVWKIYAKSGQLVVRIPEIKDPYASHLYFYVSYFNGIGSPSGVFETELLNVYKDRIRNLFEALQHNGYDVRMPADQEVPKVAGQGDRKAELFQITACNWQRQNPPAAFVKPGKAAFVCMSSLIPVDEMEWVLKNVPMHIPVVVIRLSHAIPSPFRLKLKELFFRPEPTPVDHLRQPWLVSPLRRELVRNERAIETALHARGNAWLTDTVDMS